MFNHKNLKELVFSIIIPTCNRNQELGKCLERLSIGQQTFNGSQYEVIVSDDGEEFGAEKFCLENFSWVKYTRGLRKGPASNRNNGAKLAVGTWLVFTDDDCVPDANWLSAYAEGINLHPECKAFEGAILPDDWLLLKKDMAECPVNDKGGCFWSANIMIKSCFFKKLTGFDESFKLAAFEDREIYIRVLKSTEIPFIAKAIVIHPVRFVLLADRVRTIPQAIDNWYLFEKRGMKRITLFKKGMMFQIRSMLGNLAKQRFRQSIYNLLVLLYLFPYFLGIKIKYV